LRQAGIAEDRVTIEGSTPHGIKAAHRYNDVESRRQPAHSGGTHTLEAL